MDQDDCIHMDPVDVLEMVDDLVEELTALEQKQHRTGCPASPRVDEIHLHLTALTLVLFEVRSPRS